MSDAAVADATTTSTTTATPAVTSTSTTAPAQTTDSIVQRPWLNDWVKSDGALDHKALDRMPDHLKTLRPTLERGKSFEDVLTMMQHQQVLVGKKALAPLPADSPAPVLAERKQLLDSINGVPPTPKDYGIAKPADLPDEAWNQPMADFATTWAHKHSVGTAAIKELVQGNIEHVKVQLQAQQQYEQQFWQREQANFEAITKRENIPSDRANALVEKGAIALGLDIKDEGTKTFLKGANARLMAMRHAIAVGEDSFVSGSDKTKTANPKADADDIMHNKANPLYEAYWNRDGKIPRSVVESARAKVDGLLRVHAEQNPTNRRDRR